MRTPTLTPYEPVLLGVGLVFNLMYGISCPEAPRLQQTIGTLRWTYQLPGSPKFSFKLSPLSVGFAQRGPFNLMKRPLFLKLPRGLGSCGPGKLTEKGKFPKILREGAKGILDQLGAQSSPKSLLHHPRLLLHRCKKMGLHRCKRLCAPRWSKRPLAPSPKHFWEFSLFGQFPRPAASQTPGCDLQTTPRATYKQPPFSDLI